MSTLAPKPPLPYRGRFAPSPTGPLHFGSLIAAVASFLEARTRNGDWLVRIEDIDPPREIPGAADAILRTLEAFGLHWDETVHYQRHHLKAFTAALTRLTEQGDTYPCACSRSELAATVSHHHPQYYPGTCREGLPAGRTTQALRVDSRGDPVYFEDRVQGPQYQDLEHDIGDFIVRRADALIAYQLAVVVDDAKQGITQIVRGSDLLDSTPRQLHLQRLLGLPRPDYAHLPLAVDAEGIKLSKQNGAHALDTQHPVIALWHALDFLNQAPPDALRRASLTTLWDWAHAHWSLARVARTLSRPHSPFN